MMTKFGAPVLQVEDLTEQGLFEGYGSIFGNVDRYGDVVEPGAFSRSLTEHKARGTRAKMFWQHSMHEPIGSWVDMAEDDTGLRVKGRLNLGVQRGAEAYALLKAGDIEGLSIGYVTVKSVQDRDKGVLRLTDLELIEVSLVSFGANDRALVDTVKAAEIENLRGRIAAGDRLTPREWESLFKDWGLSNSQAERAVRVHGLQVGQGEPDAEPSGDDFLAGLWAAMRDAPIIDNTGE